MNVWLVIPGGQRLECAAKYRGALHALGSSRQIWGALLWLLLLFVVAKYIGWEWVKPVSLAVAVLWSTSVLAYSGVIFLGFRKAWTDIEPNHRSRLEVVLGSAIAFSMFSLALIVSGLIPGIQSPDVLGLPILLSWPLWQFEDKCKLVMEGPSQRQAGNHAP